MKKLELLSRLNLLFESQDQFLDYEGLPVTFKSNPPATQQEITSLISNERFSVPADYLDFLKTYNGCILFEYQDISGFNFLGTNEIEKQTEFQRNNYEDEWDTKLTVFFSLLGDGDFLSFRTYNDSNFEILDCYHDDHRYNWKVIGNSFNEFLEKLINEKGRRFWL